MLLSDDPRTLAMLSMGAGLLQAGGPSTTPTGFGQAAGGAMQAGIAAFANAKKAQQAEEAQALQNKIAQAQLDQAARRQAFYTRFSAQQGQAADRARLANPALPTSNVGEPGQNPADLWGILSQDMGGAMEFAPDMVTKALEPKFDTYTQGAGVYDKRTGKIVTPATPKEQWVPVTESGIPGQRNSLTGEFKALDPTLSRVTMNPVINQPFESQFQKDYGGALGKQAAAIHDGAETARGNLARLDQLDALLKGTETGKLAPAFALAGAWADALGLTDQQMAKIGVSRQQAADAQAITAITNALTVGQIGPGGFPANNFSDADRAFLQQTMPQLSNTPGGNAVISQAMRKAAERTVLKEEMWLKARESGQDYSAFLKDWNAYVKSTPLFPKVTTPEQMDSLPSGAIFSAPDGTIRRKP